MRQPSQTSKLAFGFDDEIKKNLETTGQC